MPSSSAIDWCQMRMLISSASHDAGNALGGRDDLRGDLPPPGGRESGGRSDQADRGHDHAAPVEDGRAHAGHADVGLAVRLGIAEAPDARQLAGEPVRQGRIGAAGILEHSRLVLTAQEAQDGLARRGAVHRVAGAGRQDRPQGVRPFDLVDADHLVALLDRQPDRLVVPVDQRARFRRRGAEQLLDMVVPTSQLAETRTDAVDARAGVALDEGARLEGGQQAVQDGFVDAGGAGQVGVGPFAAVAGEHLEHAQGALDGAQLTPPIGGRLGHRRSVPGERCAFRTWRCDCRAVYFGVGGHHVSDSADLRIVGNHHLALVVENTIDATHRFWTEVMGLRFSWAVTNLYVPSTGEYSPHMHTFYELGKQGNVAYFAIQPETMRPGPNWTDHPARFIALQAASEDQLPRWKARLEAAGVAVAEDVEEDGRPALLF